MSAYNAKTAIIVLNYQNYNLTILNVDKLLKLKGDYYIVIVDNNSSNDSYEALNSNYQNNDVVFVVKSKQNGGYSAGNNLGIRKAIELNSNVKYIAVMNPDVIIEDKEIFHSMLATFEKKPFVAVIAPLMVEAGKVQESRSGWMIASIWERIFSRTRLQKCFKKQRVQENDGVLHFVDAIHGSFFIIRRDIFEKIGFFDESVFLYGEETILGLKLKRLGYTECLDYSFKYIHDHNYGKESSEKIIKQGKIQFKSMKYILNKYYDARWYHRAMYFVVQGYLYYMKFPLIITIKRILGKID